MTDKDKIGNENKTDNKSNTKKLLGLFLAGIVGVGGYTVIDSMWNEDEEEEKYYEEECQDENCGDGDRQYYNGIAHYHAYSSYFGRIPYNSVPPASTITSVPKGTIANHIAKGGLGSSAGKGGTG